MLNSQGIETSIYKTNPLENKVCLLMLKYQEIGDLVLKFCHKLYILWHFVPCYDQTVIVFSPFSLLLMEMNY